MDKMRIPGVRAAMYNDSFTIIQNSFYSLCLLSLGSVACDPHFFVYVRYGSRATVSTSGLSA